MVEFKDTYNSLDFEHFVPKSYIDTLNKEVESFIDNSDIETAKNNILDLCSSELCYEIYDMIENKINNY